MEYHRRAMFEYFMEKYKDDINEVITPLDFDAESIESFGAVLWSVSSLCKMTDDLKENAAFHPISMLRWESLPPVIRKTYRAMVIELLKHIRQGNGLKFRFVEVDEDYPWRQYFKLCKPVPEGTEAFTIHTLVSAVGLPES